MIHTEMYTRKIIIDSNKQAIKRILVIRVSSYGSSNFGISIRELTKESDDEIKKHK